MKDGLIVLAVDFDGTICEHNYPNIGVMKPNAAKILQALDKAGFKIMIHTCRTNPDITKDRKLRKKIISDMEKWLKDNSIPYDDIWRGKGKPDCHLFIDDHAFPFTGWDNVLDALLKMINYAKTGKAALPESEVIKDKSVFVNKKTGQIIKVDTVVKDFKGF